MRYSDKQLAIIKTLAETVGAGRNSITLDEIVEKVKEDIDPENKHVNFRSGVNACIRDLQRKVPKDGLTLNGNDRVGRGNKAVFVISGPYGEIYHKEQARRVQSEMGAYT